MSKMFKMVERFYLQVYGCQMNQYDAGVVRNILTNVGYEETKKEEEADLIFLITCAVREHAERRALGRLQGLCALKKKNSHKLIGVLGCMAQRMKESLINDYRVDLVIGPDEYRRLPELIRQSRMEKAPKMATNIGQECYSDLQPLPESQVSAFVTIMRGCSNFCSYCIVPYIRGPERSRPVESIITEVKQLAKSGVKEVTLLGQNVLAYKSLDEMGMAVDFADLLTRVAEMPEIERVRFLTSHPRDLNERVVESIKDLPKVCHEFHLPLQSGSNRILQLMNRGYTQEEYLKKVAMVREKIPDACLTTDIIVGFPTETKEDFAETLRIVKSVRFDFAYMYRFSLRLGTKATALKPQVPAEEAKERLERLIEVQNQITKEENEKMVGRVYEVMVEKEKPCLGRTRQGKMVVVEESLPLGSIVPVRIISIRGWTPIGKVSPESGEYRPSAVSRLKEGEKERRLIYGNF
ncbi:MAG: tRNA (N6-isopentenyl adenosine(37)-C2)-methylthiotransferase MiaB [candidate division WOR-3 bacterium]